jgi:hypothetical protein
MAICTIGVVVSSQRRMLFGSAGGGHAGWSLQTIAPRRLLTCAPLTPVGHGDLPGFAL